MRNLTDEVDDRRLMSASHPRKPSWKLQFQDLVLRVWRTRYEKEETFSHREIEFTIENDGQAVSLGRFVEWRGPPLSDLEQLVDDGHAVYQTDFEMAKVVLRHWGDAVPSPFDCGTVVRFDNVKIKANPHSGVIWNLIQSLVDREFSNRGSVLLLKPFPLEYAGSFTRADCLAFKSRVAALQRLYKYRLGMTPIHANKGGWMWKALWHCPEPAIGR
jgi:hypothetical protein